MFFSDEERYKDFSKIHYPTFKLSINLSSWFNKNSFDEFLVEKSVESIFTKNMRTFQDFQTFKTSQNYIIILPFPCFLTIAQKSRKKLCKNV